MDGGRKLTEQQNNQQEMNDQLIVRREKMSALREAGIDPFGARFDRSHNSKELHQAYEQLTDRKSVV